MANLRCVRGSVFAELTESGDVVVGTTERGTRLADTIVMVDREDVDDLIDVLLEVRLAMAQPITASDLMRRIVEAVTEGGHHG